MTIDVKWFQNRIRDLGTSQRQLSTVIATNPNTISLILNGNRKMTHDEIPILAQLLNTTSEEIIRRLGVEQPAALKDDAVECIGTVDETGRVTELKAARTVEAPAARAANTKAVIFNALAGEHVQHGWVYYFDIPAKPRAVDADTLNALCLVEIGDHEGYHVGVVRRGLERGSYDLFNAFSGERIVGGVIVRSATPIRWIKTA
jgi:transcriptional regulator with XRE-family HTH domain